MKRGARDSCFSREENKGGFAKKSLFDQIEKFLDASIHY